MSSPTFEAFRKALKGDVVTPTDPDYSKAIARWAVNNERKAKVVAFVKDAEDVSLTIRYAKNEKLRIAIRGGGHSMTSASSVENGIVIDLSRYLNITRVDADKKLAFVGGGATWETVDKAAIEHGLATVGGTVNHTGVGGLLLGGGYGYLSGSHGLVIDNLVQATVVVADGSILTASESENADLFWAIRGGGSNFGVGTEFILKLHPQRRTLFAGMAVFPPAKLSVVSKAMEEWYSRGLHEKEVIYLVIGRGPDGNPFVALILVYNGSEQEGRSAFKSFFDLEPAADMCKEIPFQEVNTIMNHIAGPGKYRYTKSVHEDAPNHKVLAEEYEKFLPLSEKSGFDIGIIHEYWSMNKITSVASDATAFALRTPKFNTLVLTTWEDNVEENTKYAKEAVAELTAFIIKAQKDTDNIGYSNYNADEVQVISKSSNKSKTLFGDNYPRLQQIKKKYDPDMIFSQWFPIVPA